MPSDTEMHLEDRSTPSKCRCGGVTCPSSVRTDMQCRHFKNRRASLTIMRDIPSADRWASTSCLHGTAYREWIASEGVVAHEGCPPATGVPSQKVFSLHLGRRAGTNSRNDCCDMPVVSGSSTTALDQGGESSVSMPCRALMHVSQMIIS